MKRVVAIVVLVGATVSGCTTSDRLSVQPVGIGRTPARGLCIAGEPGADSDVVKHVTLADGGQLPVVRVPETGTVVASLPLGAAPGTSPPIAESPLTGAVCPFTRAYGEQKTVRFTTHHMGQVMLRASSGSRSSVYRAEIVIKPLD